MMVSVGSEELLLLRLLQIEVKIRLATLLDLPWRVLGLACMSFVELKCGGWWVFESEIDVLLLKLTKG